MSGRRLKIENNRLDYLRLLRLKRILQERIPNRSLLNFTLSQTRRLAPHGGAGKLVGNEKT